MQNKNLILLTCRSKECRHQILYCTTHYIFSVCTALHQADETILLTMFTEQLPDLLNYVDNLQGFGSLVGYMNIHLDNPLQSQTKQTMTTLSLHSHVQVINEPTHSAVMSLTGLLFDLTMTSMKNLLLQSHLNHAIIASNPTSMFQSLCLLPYTGLFGTLLKLTTHPLLLNCPVFQSFHLLKRQTSSVTFRALY